MRDSGTQGDSIEDAVGRRYATGAALPTASGRAGSGSPVLGVVPATGTTPNGAGVRGGAADSAALFPYPNPRLPAYPPPTVVTALAAAVGQQISLF